MKLISLNIWGGKIHDPLLEFINKYKEKADIFTLQEIFKSDRNILTHGSYSNIIKEIETILPDFNGYFYPTANSADIKGPVDFTLYFGQETFIRKDIKVIEVGDVFIHKNINEVSFYPDGRPNFPRNFIYTEIEENGKRFLVLNLHGFWEPAPKYDTEERFKQSQVVIDFIKNRNLPAIIAGDFNLRIETKALKMFEKNGFRNLVKESKALTTRSTLYNIKWRSFDKYADYILTSKGIWVTDFKVMRAKVSDHLPLFLEFEVS